MSASATSLDRPAPGRLAACSRDAGFGLLAVALLLGVYLGVVTLVSGWTFALEQFAQFGAYIVALAVGFGIQVALFARLRAVVARAKRSGTVLAASGTTSTAAMISCCAHYVANVAPVLGATGLVAFAAQFQVQLFWAGLLFNAAGIGYIAHNLRQASREHAECLV